MDSIKKIGSIGHLNQHKLGSIIGSFQKRKLAVTSEKGWISINKKNFSDSFPIEGVICRKPPRGGKKKKSNSVLTNLMLKIMDYLLKKKLWSLREIITV